MTSFDFVWNNNPSTITGKVLARRRIKPNEKNRKEISETVSTNPPVSNKKNPTKLLGKVKANEKNKPEISKKVQGTSSAVTIKPTKLIRNAKDNLQKTIPTNEASENQTKKLVKRKHKKDKAAASLATNKPEQHPKNDKFLHSLFSEKQSTTIKPISKLPGVAVVEKVFSSSKVFSDLNIHKYMVSNLEKHGFTTLTNVQEKAIPVMLKGGDILVRSQTGSGKTLAYAIPIIEALHSITPKLERNQGVQAIIVVPTRELALQTHEIFTKLCTFQWLVIGHLCGGENRNTEKNRLRKGTHVLIATPGRLLDHILHTASFKINNVRCLVLDEADRLLDMGFKKDIIKITEELDKSKTEYNPLDLLRGISNKPDETKIEESGYCLSNIESNKRQTVLLSATLTKDIAELAKFTMKNHEYIDALDKTINVSHMIIPKNVKQEYIITFVKHRLFTLASILLAKSKQNGKILVFMATSQMVDFHYDLFTKYLKCLPVNRGKVKYGDVVISDVADFSDDEDNEEEVVMDVEFFKLHGSMEQIKRKEEFTGFRKAKRGILLCTDVAARGIDVPQADYVIQYTGPQTDEDYLHRVGRTGRVNHTGTALIFLTQDEQEYIMHLQKHKIFLNERKFSEFSRHLCDLMEEVEEDKAALALQKRFEEAVQKDKDLYKSACFAHSSWSRFYNSYPAKLRKIFNFQAVNLGHYVTSFAIRDTPSTVAKMVRGQIPHLEPKRLNRKLNIHEENEEILKKRVQKRKIRSISLTTSEFSSGLESKKKKKCR